MIRVFPRRTSATPGDDLAYVGLPEFWTEADRVEISVAFTWDLPHAEWLAKQWEQVAPVTIGGPATGIPGDEFVPGRYLRHGYTITSRGCPRRCQYCQVWRREGTVRELAIRDGWIVQDDNLLACSQKHIRAVFDMLRRQPQRVKFTGGLEAARLTDWHVDLLVSLCPQPRIFFSYDCEAEYDELVRAVDLLDDAAFSFRAHDVRCYVLIGHPGDTLADAERRLRQMTAINLTPMAMLYRPPAGSCQATSDWRRLQRDWARPAIIHAKGS